LPDPGTPSKRRKNFLLALPRAGATAPTETAPLHLVEQVARDEIRRSRENEGAISDC